MVLLKPRRIWLLFWLGSVQVYRSSSQMVLWFFLFKICSNKAFWITSFPLISSSSIDRFNPPWPSWVVKTTLTWSELLGPVAFYFLQMLDPFKRDWNSRILDSDLVSEARFCFHLSVLCCGAAWWTRVGRYVMTLCLLQVPRVFLNTDHNSEI